MKIFADFHHSGLFTSLKYLFEGRLGHTLYRPIGTEWFTEGYWKIAEPYGNNIGTVNQFLKPGSTPTDGTRPLNEQLDDCLTLEQFKNTDIDIIVASIPAHIEAYSRLIHECKPSAKLVYQIGNIGWHNEIPWDSVTNIMASVKPFMVPKGKNVVFYRQEFDLNIFKPGNNDEVLPFITSFVNCLPQPEKYEKLKTLLSEYEFKAFGASCPDGVINNTSTIASIMQHSMFGYHNKPHGDGFGHVIHNWFAVGKPIIVNTEDYKDKLAGELLRDGVTCIDMCRKSEVNIADEIRHVVSTGMYKQMCENVKERFGIIVNYNQDANNVANFLEKVVG